MASSGIFANTDEVVRKAGDNLSTSSKSDDFINDYLTQAESEINVATRYNWSDAYSGLDAHTKGILKKAATCLAAVDAITYDMDSIGVKEAESRINVLRDTFLRMLGILKDKNKQAFLNDPSKGTLPG